MGTRALSLAMALAVAGYVSLSSAWKAAVPPSYVPLVVLGGDAEGTLDRIEPLLRNQAFIGEPEITSQGARVELERIEGTPFFRPVEIIEPGALVYLRGAFAPSGIVVGEIIDELPPSRPSLVEASYLRFYEQHGCGGVPESVSFDDSLPGELFIEFEGDGDDHAGWDSLTYLIYVGETASEAAMSAASIHYLIAESEGRLVDLERETSLMHALENARFVAIEAVDRAGNRSERSAPIELVHRLGIVN